MGSEFAHVGVQEPTTSVLPADMAGAGTRAASTSSGKPPLPWRRVTRDAVGIFLVTRLAYALVTYFAEAFVLNSVNGTVVSPSLSSLLLGWQTGDVGNYLTIASQGYTHGYLTAFFPLYPLLIHVFALGQSGPFELAVAMVISNLGTLAALIGLGLLASQEFGFDTAVPTLRALISFPLAFFLAMGYADNLFLALVVFALLFARRGGWGVAIVCTFASALLRPTGVTLTLPLLWEYGRQQEWWTTLWSVARRERTLARGYARLLASGVRRLVVYPVLLLAAAPAGVALFAAYCWSAFGNPLIFLQVQETHFYRVSMPLPRSLYLLAHTLRSQPLLSFLEARNLIDLAPIIICGVLVALACVLRQMPITYLLYVLGVFYADLAAPMAGRYIPFPSVGRHMLLAVPVFLLLGKWSTRRPWLDTLLVTLGFLLQGVFLVAVIQGNLHAFNAID